MANFGAPVLSFISRMNRWLESIADLDRAIALSPQSKYFEYSSPTPVVKSLSSSDERSASESGGHRNGFTTPVGLL